MELNTYSRQSLYFIWKVRNNIPDSSEVIVIEDTRWQLEVHVGEDKNGKNDVWMFFLRKVSPIERSHNFRITIYFQSNQDGERQLELIGCKTVYFMRSHVEIVCLERFLSNWTVPVSHAHEDTMTFVVFFDNHIQLMSEIQQDGETGHQLNRTLLARDKGVQTPSYLEKQPCLISLSEDFKKLEDPHSSPDLKILCGDDTIAAHRNVLASRSKVFEAMLQADMAESRTRTVEIVDMEFPVLQAFLGYLYTGTLPEMTVELASRLYEVSDKYKVVALMNRCADFLKENVTHQNACRLLVLADTHADKEFKEFVICYILNERTIYNDEEWDSFCASNRTLANEVLNRAVKEKYSK